MENLMMDVILLDILPKLPAKSLLRFKCVCKTFEYLISSPKFIQLHLKESTSLDANRLLVLPGKNRCVYVFDLESPQSPATTFIWRDFESTVFVVGSCNGLLCLVRDYTYGTQLILLNPSTRSELRVRFEGVRVYDLNFGFGFDDVTGDYKIVAVSDYYLDNNVKRRDVKVYSLKAKSWRLVDRTSPEDSMEQRYGGALINNHLIHWMFWCPSKGMRRIGCFDIRVEQWKDDVLLPDYYYDPRHSNYLLDFGVLDGSLYSSFENRDDNTFDVWVMKKYGVKDSWIKLLSVPILDDLRGGFVPISYRGGSGHGVLLRQRHQSKLFWGNSRTNAITEAEFRWIPDFSNLQAYICKGSLLGIPGGKQFGAVEDSLEERMEV